MAYKGKTTMENLAPSLQQKIEEGGVEIVNDLTTGGVDKAASAETVKTLKTELDNKVTIPEYGVQVITPNHAIRRFPTFNAWTKSDLPELLSFIFNYTATEVEGAFVIRAMTPEEPAKGLKLGSYIASTTGRSLRAASSPFYSNSETDVIQTSEGFADSFYWSGAVGQTTSAPYNGRVAFSFVKIAKQASLSVEIELRTTNGKAKEILESIETLHQDGAYSSPWTLPRQQSLRWLARNSLTRMASTRTLWVNSVTGDNATAVAGDITKPFKTVMGAINSLPKFFDSGAEAFIYVEAGTYNETITLSGFAGNGKITLRGGGSSTEAASYKFYALNITNCNIQIDVVGFQFGNSGYRGATITNSLLVYLTNCDLSSPSLSNLNGVQAECSNVYVATCKISNRSQAIFATFMSRVYAFANEGTGNTVALMATNNSVIGKAATQPSGTTAENTYGGSVIRA